MKHNLKQIVITGLVALKDLGYITQADLKELGDLLSDKLRSKKQRIADILESELND